MHASGKRQGVKHQSRVRKLSLHDPYTPGVARDLRRAACGMRGDFSGSAGKLQAAAAIVMGVCSNCDSEDDPPGQRTADVLRERLGSLGKPVLCDVSFGHTSDKLTLPLGVQSMVSPRAGLVLTEAALEEAPANVY